jgi:hypothetical protein
VHVSAALEPLQRRVDGLERGPSPSALLDEAVNRATMAIRTDANDRQQDELLEWPDQSRLLLT